MVPLGVLSVLVLIGLLIFSLLKEPETTDREPRVAGDLPNPLEAPSLYEVMDDTAALPRMTPQERAILERHFFALGGVERLASINSLLATGEMLLADGRILPVVMAKKHGGRIRVTFRQDNRQVVMVVTPDDAWKTVWQAGRLAFVGNLLPEERENLRRSSYVVSELFLAMLNTWTVGYLGEQAFNYRMSHCFEVRISDRNRIRFFIDPETFLDLGREDWVFAEDGTLSLTRFINHEHRNVDGFRIPGKMEMFANNVLVQTFRAQEFEVNPGILDQSFRRPESPRH